MLPRRHVDSEDDTMLPMLHLHQRRSITSARGSAQTCFRSASVPEPEAAEAAPVSVMFVVIVNGGECDAGV